MRRTESVFPRVVFPAGNEGGTVKVVLALATAFCLACLLTGPGCDKFAEADYWPMAEGNLWRYRSVAIDAQPDSVPDTVISGDAMTWVTRRETLDNGMKVWA